MSGATGRASDDGILEGETGAAGGAQDRDDSAGDGVSALGRRVVPEPTPAQAHDGAPLQTTTCAHSGGGRRAAGTDGRDARTRGLAVPLAPLPRAGRDPGPAAIHRQRDFSAFVEAWLQED